MSEEAPENVARFLGRLGHPIHAFPQYPDKHNVLHAGDEFHRTVAQLKQYCGVGAPNTHKKEDGDLSQAQVLAGGKDSHRVALHRIVTGMNGNIPAAAYKELFDEEKAWAVTQGWDMSKSKALRSNRAVQHGLRIVKKRFL